MTSCLFRHLMLTTAFIMTIYLIPVDASGAATQTTTELEDCEYNRISRLLEKRSTFYDDVILLIFHEALVERNDLVYGLNYSANVSRTQTQTEDPSTIYLILYKPTQQASSLETSASETFDRPSLPAKEDDLIGCNRFVTSSSSSHFIWTAPESSEVASSECLSIIPVIESSDSNDVIIYGRPVTLCPPSDSACRQYKTGEEWGLITSPGYPQRYPDNANCVFTIVGYPGASIDLQFQAIQLEPAYSGKCVDYVTIVAPDVTSEPLCGVIYNEASLQDQRYISWAGYLRVEFRSDSKTSDKGFTAFYAIRNPLGCNVALNETSGTISSPRYPLPYHPNTFCTYSIRLPPSYRVILTLLDFDLGLNHQNQTEKPNREQPICSGDTVVITDLLSNASKTLQCQHKRAFIANQIIFESSSSEIDIQFSSDHHVQGHGFEIKYKGVPSCKNESLSGLSGKISSPNHPHNYPNNQKCFYQIRTSSSISDYNESIGSTTANSLNSDKGVTLMLKFLSMYTEASSDDVGDSPLRNELCTRDFLHIRSGNTVHRVCGNWSGKEHIITFRDLSPSITITFVSDDQGTRSGFSLEWTTVISNRSLHKCLPETISTEMQHFEVMYGSLSWDDAETDCRSRGGHLATVGDLMTQTLLTDKIDDAKNQCRNKTSFWIGANDLQWESDFYWISGGKTQFTNWFPGWAESLSAQRQPSDDGLANEDCVELRRQFHLPWKGTRDAGSYFWNDRDCGERNPYICGRLKNRQTIIPPACDREIHLSLQPNISSHNQTTNNTLDSGNMGTSRSGAVILSSLNYPDNYKDFLNCSITIISPPGAGIMVEFDRFWLEDSDDFGNCVYDSLAFSPYRDPTTGHVVRPESVCGDWTGKEKMLHHVIGQESVTLTFVTDHSRTFPGFQARALALDASHFCGPGDWRYTSGQCLMVSPRPVAMEDAVSDCRTTMADVWTSHKIPSTHPWVDVLTDFQIDWLLLWNPQESDISTDQCAALNVSLTQQDPGERRVQIERISIVRCDEKLRYACYRLPMSYGSHELYLNQSYTSPSNLSLSTLFNTSNIQHYENLAQVWISISAPENNEILISLSNIDIETQQHCSYDYIQINNSSLDKKLCGKMAENEEVYVVSKTNEATIYFKSDYSVTGNGVDMTWSWVDQGQCHQEYFINTSSSFQVTTLNFPKPYPAPINCSITLRSTDESIVSTLALIFDEITPLHFIDGMQVTLSENNIRESVENNNEAMSYTLNSSLYSNSLKPVFVSSTGYLRIDYTNSNGINVGEGFRASIEAKSDSLILPNTVKELQEGESTHIYNIGHPGQGPSNVLQDITIRVPIGYNVELSLMEYGGISEVYCDARFIQLDDVSKSEAVPPLSTPKSEDRSRSFIAEPLGKWCSPSDTNSTIVSTLNRMRIRISYGKKRMNLRLQFVILAAAVKDLSYLEKTKYDFGNGFDSCMESPCLNDGVCQASGEGWSTCDCKPRYGGMFCQDLWCNLSPCVHGWCNMTSWGYFCTCKGDFFGPNCDLDEWACANQLCNAHGRCLQRNQTHPMCKCHEGWSGVMCANRVDEGEESLSLGQRLLKEPIWIGLIVILSVLLMFGITYIIRRRCGKYFSCCDIKKPRVNDNILNADGTIALNSFPLRGRISRPSCVSLPKSTVSDGTHTVTIKAETDSDADALTPTPTPSGRSNGEAAARFFASYKNADKNPIAPPLTTDFTRTTDTSLSQEVDDASVGAMVGGRLLFDLHIRENKAKAKEESTVLERSTSMVNLSTLPNHVDKMAERMKKRASHSSGAYLVRQEAQFDEFSVSGSSPSVLRKNLSVGSNPRHIYPHVIVEKCDPSSPDGAARKRVNINDIEEELLLKEIKITVPVSPKNNQNGGSVFADTSGARVIEVNFDGESDLNQKTPSLDAISVQTVPSLSSRPAHVKGHKRVVSMGDEETLSREIEKLIKYRKFIKEWKTRTNNSYSVASSSSLNDTFDGQSKVLATHSLDSDHPKRSFKYFKKRNKTLDYPLRHLKPEEENASSYQGELRRKREKYSKKLFHSSHSLDEAEFMRSQHHNSNSSHNHHSYSHPPPHHHYHSHHNHRHHRDRHDGYRSRKHGSYHMSWDIPEFPDANFGDEEELYHRFNQKYVWNSTSNPHDKGGASLPGQHGYWSHSKRGNLTASTSDLTHLSSKRLEPGQGHERRPTSRQSTLTHKHRKSKRSRHSSTRSTRSQSHYPRIHESSSESDILVMANRLNPYSTHSRLPQYNKPRSVVEMFHEPNTSKHKPKVKTQMSRSGLSQSYTDTTRNSNSLPDVSHVDRAAEVFSSIFSQEIELDDFSPVEDNIDFETLRPNGKNRDTLLTTSWPYLPTSDTLPTEPSHFSSNQYLSTTHPSDPTHPHTDSEIDYKSRKNQIIHENHRKEQIERNENTKTRITPQSKQNTQRLNNNNKVSHETIQAAHDVSNSTTPSCKVMVYNSHGKVSETARRAFANSRQHFLTRKHSSLDLIDHSHLTTINLPAIRPASSLQDLTSTGAKEQHIVIIQPSHDPINSRRDSKSNAASRVDSERQKYKTKKPQTPSNSLNTGAESTGEENNVVNGGETFGNNADAVTSRRNKELHQSDREIKTDKYDKHRDAGLYLCVTDTDSAMSSAPSHNSTPTGAKAMADSIEKLYSYETKVKDSAYETKQSSLEAEAYLESKGIKTKVPARTEDRRVTQRLTQAAVKLFIMQQRVRKGRQHHSLDSSIHTISEDDPSLDDIIVTNSKSWSFKPGVLYPANSEGDECNSELRPLHCDRILEEKDCRVEYEV